jgi:hypothetical protein
MNRSSEYRKAEPETATGWYSMQYAVCKNVGLINSSLWTFRLRTKIFLGSVPFGSGVLRWITIIIWWTTGRYLKFYYEIILCRETVGKMSKTRFPRAKVPRILPPLFPFSCVQKRRANIEEDIQEPSSSTLLFPVRNGEEREGGRIFKKSPSSFPFFPMYVMEWRVTAQEDEQESHSSSCFPDWVI